MNGRPNARHNGDRQEEFPIQLVVGVMTFGVSSSWRPGSARCSTALNEDHRAKLIMMTGPPWTPATAASAAGPLSPETRASECRAPASSLVDEVSDADAALYDPAVPAMKRDDRNSVIRDHSK